MARFVDRATGVAMRRGGSAPWTMMLACLLACAAGDFRPSTPREFLKKFNEYSSLQSGRDRIGGASFFRTKLQVGTLIGSFITETPDKMIADIKRNSSLVLLWTAEVTPGIFVMHETSKQESLK